jgi:hypothetical protein
MTLPKVDRVAVGADLIPAPDARVGQAADRS